MEETTVAQQLPKKKKRNKYAAPIGGIYIVLAIIGMIAVIFGGFQLIGKLTDKSKQL